MMTNSPTKIGWHWFRQRVEDVGFENIDIAWVTDDGHGNMVAYFVDAEECEYVDDLIGEWWGPLVSPWREDG